MTCDLPEFSREAVRKARKHHRCTECRGSIPAGHRYQLYTGKWGGEMGVYRFHLTCWKIREAYTVHETSVTGRAHDEIAPFGDLIEYVREDASEAGDFPLYWPPGVYIGTAALARYTAMKEGIVA
jgi:hypothetical protein